ncbi:MAG: formate dehydrogenase accessory protein FdhE, partial [Janthinobacterium lividum]|nr:formate dehydrogenase accessory protein FdhE [Janthinobacterium lividum]
MERIPIPKGLTPVFLCGLRCAISIKILLQHSQLRWLCFAFFDGKTPLVQRILQPGEIEGLDHNAIPRLLLPQPDSLFKARALRLRELAQGNIKGIPVDAGMQGYLVLMAALADAQAAVVGK